MLQRRVWLATLALAWPLWAGAAGPPGQGDGFSGSLRAGFAYLSSTDQLGVNDGNRRIRDLDGEASRYDAFVPVVLFDLRYGFGEDAPSLYLKTPFEGGEGPPGVALGVTQATGDGGEVDASVWANPFGSVWQDPYLVGVERDETPRRQSGVHLAWRQPFATDLVLQYAYTRADVGSDQVGERFGALARDGSRHRLGVGYRVQLPQALLLEPSLGYTHQDVEGQAESFDGWGAGLALRRFSGGYALNLMLRGEREVYAARHPVFGRTRRDYRVSVFGIFTRRGLFGVRGLLSDWVAGYSLADSNIDFLDSQGFFGALTLGYEF